MNFWRDDPVTEKQLNYIMEMQENSPYELPRFTGTTKGEASDYINEHFKAAHTNLWSVLNGYC